ncbi:MAG: hypothetical protein RLY70_970 [Planctomycetota bacterium]
MDSTIAEQQAWAEGKRDRPRLRRSVCWPGRRLRHGGKRGCGMDSAIAKQQARAGVQAGSATATPIGVRARPSPSARR